MATLPILFLNTLDNSTKAIREKRYDLVQIFGNRLLSDLLIFERDLTQPQASLISFIGLFVRRAGIDLSGLSQNSYDTAKLKQRTIDSITTFKNLLSSKNENYFEEGIAAYQKYEEAWAEEMNANDLAKYTREGFNDNSIYTWALEGFRSLEGKEHLVYSYPISGISNELARLSYMEKLATRTLMLAVTARALEWFSVTINQAVQEIHDRTLESKQRKELTDHYESNVLNFTSSILEIYGNWQDKDANEIPQTIVSDNLLLIKDILIEWRKLLNDFYQVNTSFPAKSPKMKHAKEQTEEDEDEKSKLRKQHRIVPK